MTYKEQLKSPKWQRKRLEIFERDKFTCQICLDTEEQIQVHHKSYDNNKQAWEYGNDRLITLCSTCHTRLTAHIKTHGTEDRFNLLKLKAVGGNIIITYTHDCVSIEYGKNFLVLEEWSANKIVQFLINNWLKNG